MPSLKISNPCLRISNRPCCSQQIQCSKQLPVIHDEEDDAALGENHEGMSPFFLICNLAIVIHLLLPFLQEMITMLPLRKSIATICKEKIMKVSQILFILGICIHLLLPQKCICNIALGNENHVTAEEEQNDTLEGEDQGAGL